MIRVEHLLERAAGLYPDRPAVRDAAREVTWSELYAESRALAERLARGAGVGPGDRVAIAARNRIEYVAAYFACAMCSAVLVPLNTRLAPREIEELVRRSRARAALAEQPLSLPEGCRGIALDAASPGWTALADLPRGPAPPPARDPSLVAVQMYTSGTTGLPKGAMLSHANVTAMTSSWLLELPLRSPADTFLQVTPLFHVGAMLMAMSCAATGARLILLPEFSPTAVGRALAEDGVTHTLLVPAMIRWVLDEPATSGLTFPHLRMVVYGAAPIPAELLARAQARFGCAFLQGYGLTETAGVLTTLRPEDHVEGRLTSAGRPVLGVEVRLVDPSGADVPEGAVGEIVARGPNVFVGYHELPEATAEAVRDGWFWTGDLAVRDGAGFLTIVDRSKDMILVGGENVYPREVEDALRSHALVRDVAVIGVPHAVWGEAVVAVVVPTGPIDDEGAATRSIVRHARAALAQYKCPSRVVFAEDLPRNAAGKVLKAQLRAPFWANRDRQV